MRTAFMVVVAILLAIPATIAAAPGPRDKRNPNTSGPGQRSERGVPEPSTILLLGAAAGVAYGVRKFRSKRR